MTHLRNKLVTLYISKLASLIQLGQVISLHNPLAIQVVYARFPEEEGFIRITCSRLRNHVLNIASLPALHKEGFYLGVPSNQYRYLCNTVIYYYFYSV